MRQNKQRKAPEIKKQDQPGSMVILIARLTILLLHWAAARDHRLHALSA